jgi:hypothetical protein
MSATLKISRTNAVKLLKESKGRIFTIEFDKKNSTHRQITGNACKNFETELGYLRVNDYGSKGIRNIDPRTMKAVRMNRQKYVISK